MDKTAKQLRDEFSTINHYPGDRQSYHITPEQFQAFCDQLCKEQSVKCADIYLKERCNNLESSVESIAESIRNAPQPTTNGE